METYPLRAERKRRGWSQTKIAAALGVTTRTVSRWELGLTMPYPYYREQLCVLFGKNAKELGLLCDSDEQDILEQAPLVQPTTPDIPGTLSSVNTLVGREELFLQVKEHLLAGNHVALTAQGGLPGIGKTALAVALVRDREVQAHFRDGILWAGPGLHPNMLRLLARWGKLLGIAPSHLDHVNSRESWGQALRDAIGLRRLLLVIDDAWTAEDVLALQVGGPACTYLLTTRQSQVASAFAQEGTIVIPQLAEDDGLALLASFVPQLVQQDPEEARVLVRALDGLPLALMLMGKYLASQSFTEQSRPLQATVVELNNTEECLRMKMPMMPEEDSGSVAESIPFSLHAAIALCDQRLSPQAHTALHALSVFPPKPNSFSEEAALAASQQPVEALDELWDAGLLENWGSERYALHQAIADSIRAQSKVWAAQKQRGDDAHDSWLTNLFGEQESNDLPTTESANPGHEQHESVTDKIDQTILSLPKNINTDTPLMGRMQIKRSRFLGLVFLCLAIIVSGIYAAFLPLRTIKPAGLSGLIGYWPLNEGSGASALDASGNGNRAQINGATWTTGGRLGKALSFNGSSDTVDINKPIVDTSASFTVAAWVRLSDPNGWHTAVSQDGNNVSGFFLQATPDRQFAFSLVNPDSLTSTTIRATSNFSLVTNVWYHLVGVYDAGATQSSLYVNGLLRSTQRVPAAWNAGGETVIGRGKWGKASDFWSGKIEDVRLYNHALSATDVTNLYGSFRQ